MTMTVDTTEPEAPPPAQPEAAPAPAAPRPPRARARRAGRGSTLFAMLERKLGLTTVGIGLALVAVLLFVGARMAKNRGLALGAYALIMLLAAAWMLGRRKLNVETDRSDVPSRIRAGRPVDVRISLVAKRRLSGIIVEELLDEHLGASVRVAVPVLPTGQSVEHEYVFNPTLRGVYKVGPLVAEWSDPFGLTRRRQEIAPAVDIIVHPNTEAVVDRITSREWEDPPIRPPISKPWPTGFEFYGMRDYVPGDDPRRIVWRAVAQYDKYLVREAEQGITDRVNIYLDSDGGSHSPGTVSTTFETGVAVAASLATKHLKDGFAVSLDVNSGRLADAYRGQPKVIPLLDALAALKPEQHDFTAALDRLCSDPRRSSHNVVVTPHLTQQGAARLRLMRERGASLLLVLLIWDDTDPLTVRRAASLGCNVVEVLPNTPLQTVFSHVVSSRR